MASLMLKALFARNATRKTNTTKRILSDEYMPTCMTDCDNLWDSESADVEQTLEKGKTYCFGIENVQSRGSGDGFIILNGDDIDVISYDYQCKQKKSVKNIYAATTPTNEGRLFKLKSNKDQTIYFTTIGLISFSTTLTINGRKIKETAKIYVALKKESSKKISSKMTLYTNNDSEESNEYIAVFNPKGVSLSANNNQQSTAMVSTKFDSIALYGEKIEGDYETEAGIIQAIPSDLVGQSSVSAGTYTAQSTITIKHNDGIELPEKFIELTPDTIFSKNEDESDDGSNSKTTTKEESDSKTGLIVGVVVGVVVVVAIVAFCVYWFACRTKSDDKEETPKV